MTQMKRTRLIPLLGMFLCSVLVVTSCKKEEAPELPSEQNSEGKDLEVSLDAALSGLKALQFQIDDESEDGQGAKAKLISSTDWTTHCFLRKPGRTKVIYFTIPHDTWQVSKDLNNSSVFDLKFKKGKKIKINSSDLSEGEWLLTAFVGGGKYKEGRLYFTDDDDNWNQYNEARKVATVNIPFSTPWVKVEVKNENSTLSLDAHLNFTPRGNTLRLRLGNTTREDLWIERVALTSSDASFSSDVNFDPTHGNANDMPQLKPTQYEDFWGIQHIRTTFTYRVHKVIGKNKTGSKDKSSDHLFLLAWGVGSSENETKLRVAADDYKLRSVGAHGVNPSDFSVLISRRLRDGVSGYKDIQIVRPKTVLEFIADVNLSPKRRELVRRNDSYSSGYYDQREIDKYGERFFLPDGTYIPTADDWQTLFPSENLSPQFINFGHTYRRQTNKETIRIYGQRFTHRCDYMGVESRQPSGRNIVYALRFQPVSAPLPNYPALGHNGYLSAYKYEYLEEDDLRAINGEIPLIHRNLRGQTLRITSFFLGDDHQESGNITVEDLHSHQEFWKGADPEGRRYVVYLPLCGRAVPSAGVTLDEINQYILRGDFNAIVSYTRGVGPSRFADAYYMVKGPDGKGQYWFLDIGKTTGTGLGPRAARHIDTKEFPVIRPFFRFLE